MCLFQRVFGDRPFAVDEKEYQAFIVDRDHTVQKLAEKLRFAEQRAELAERTYSEIAYELHGVRATAESKTTTIAQLQQECVHLHNERDTVIVAHTRMIKERDELYKDFGRVNNSLHARIAELKTVSETRFVDICNLHEILDSFKRAHNELQRELEAFKASREYTVTVGFDTTELQAICDELFEEIEINTELESALTYWVQQHAAKVRELGTLRKDHAEVIKHRDDTIRQLQGIITKGPAENAINHNRALCQTIESLIMLVDDAKEFIGLGLKSTKARADKIAWLTERVEFIVAGKA